MNFKPWTTLAVLVLGLAGTVATQADSRTSSPIPGFPFLATATASVNAYEQPGQNRLAIIRMGERIKLVECGTGYCKTILPDGRPAWVSLEWMRDYEHVPNPAPVIIEYKPLVRDLGQQLTIQPIRP